MKQDKLQPVTNPDWGQTPYHEVEVSRYISPEHVRLESERLWPHAWQMACREEEIPEAGDYFEFEIGDQSLLITRTPSGEIKAFFNSCLHRGTQLAKGCGNLTSFNCPFHGWSWSLDGENRQVLDAADFPGIEDQDLRLPQAQVGTWGGFVFVKLTERRTIAGPIPPACPGAAGTLPSRGIPDSFLAIDDHQMQLEGGPGSLRGNLSHTWHPSPDHEGHGRHRHRL